MTRRTFIQSLVAGSGAIVFGAAVAVRAEPKEVRVEDPTRFWMCSTPTDGPNWFFEEWSRAIHDDAVHANGIPADCWPAYDRYVPFTYPGRAKPQGGPR